MSVKPRVLGSDPQSKLGTRYYPAKGGSPCALYMVLWTSNVNLLGFLKKSKK